MTVKCEYLNSISDITVCNLHLQTDVYTMMGYLSYYNYVVDLYNDPDFNETADSMKYGDLASVLVSKSAYYQTMRDDIMEIEKVSRFIAFDEVQSYSWSLQVQYSTVIACSFLHGILYIETLSES